MFRTVLAALLAIVFCGGSASGEIIYYQEGFSSNLYRFDTSTATNSFIGNMGVGFSWGFAFSPSGTLYGITIDNGNLYTINTSTAALTLIGSTGVRSEALTFNLAGNVLYANNGIQLFAINPTNGNATLLGSLNTVPDALTVTPVPLTIQGVNMPAGTILAVDSGALSIINVAIPSATPLGSIPADEAFDFASDGTLYGHADDGKFYRIGLNPLSSVVIGNSTPFNVFAMAVQPSLQVTEVPEPASLALWSLLGVAALAAWRRRGSA